jgi:6-phosphogluconolactonase
MLRPLHQKTSWVGKPNGRPRVLHVLTLCGAIATMAGAACSSEDTTLPFDPIVDRDAGIDGAVSPESGPVADASTGEDAAIPPGELLMLVGSGDGHIRSFMFSSEGAITKQGDSTVGGNPSFLAVDTTKRRVFAVGEANPGTVRGYLLDPTTLNLTPVGASQTTGAGPTHISLTPSASHVLVANYTAGSAAVFPVLADGALGAASDQEASGTRAHHITTDATGTFAFVTCLGTNRVEQYRFAGGAMTSNGALTFAGNPGPRHLSFRPDQRFAYVIHELSSEVATLRYDNAAGTLALVATQRSTPAGFSGANTGAEIFTHPRGHSVYASNRGHNSIVHFASDATSGALTLVGHTPTGGNTPRSFGIDPAGQWLAVGNQGSGTVRVFPLDAAGALRTPLPDITVPSPTFVGLYRVMR